MNEPTNSTPSPQPEAVQAPGVPRFINDYEMGYFPHYDDVRVVISELRRLEQRVAELEAHEQQTHSELGEILGSDDSLAECAKHMRSRAESAEAALAALKESLGAAQFERRAESVADSICQYLKLPIGESVWRQIVLEVQYALAAARKLANAYARENRVQVEHNRGLERQLAANERELIDARRKLEAKDAALRVKIIRDDKLPAFGGYCWKDHGKDDEEIILLNVEACLGGLADEEGNPVESTSDEKKYILITTLMHEFGHALEHHFKTSGPNEDSIESAIESWESATKAALAPLEPEQAHCENCDWTFDCFTDLTKCRKPEFRMKEAT